MVRKKILLIITLIMMIMALPISALAGSDSGGGVTLTYPDNMTTCEPTFHFTTTGVDPSWTVNWYIYQSQSGTWNEIGSGSTTGNLDVTYTPAPLTAGTSEVYGFLAWVWKGEPWNPDTPFIKLKGQWRVDCEQPPGGGEGCTPGFWKNHPDVWPIPTDTDFDITFGRDAFNPDITFEQAVDLRGGGLNALSRHAAAAYLNALSPVVNYDLTAADVIAAFQAAFDSGDYNTTKNMFETLNELGCPY